MPKLKSFRQLSRRQRNRRLKKIQNYKCLIKENIEELRQNDIKSEIDEENSNNSCNFITDHHSVVHHNNPNNFFINTENQPTITDVSIFSEEVYHCISFLNNKISLREKLILWTDKYKIQITSLTALLNILKDEGYNNLPNDGRTLMATPRITTIYKKSGGNYFHYGLQNGIIDELNRLNISKLNSPIFINLNIDGLPISKSSKSQLWPILAQIVLQNHTSTIPFIVGAYHGYKKPSTDNHFLEHFINEYKELNTTGFIFENNIYKVEIRAVICDSPARAFVTCTKSHNAYFGCSKCIVEGKYENHKMLFLDQDCPLRTDDTFKNRQNPEHHTGTSLFEEISLPMVTAFPLDYMHLICLGQMKKLLILWFRGPILKKEDRFGQQIKNLTLDMISLKKYVCSEFVRVPINFEELDRWKATEFRIFLLYLGPILLRKYLPYNYIKHFTVLHCALRILCHPQDSLQNYQYAKELLHYFVQYYKILYGKNNMIYTIHNLIHLSDDVKHFGALDSFSTFPFENHLYSLKKLLRKYEKPLQQIHRRIVEKNIANQFKKYKNASQYPMLISRNKKNLPFDCSESYDILKFNDFKLSCCTQADRFCFLKNNKVVMIHHIGLKNGNAVILGQEYINYSSFHLYPCDSQHMNVFVVSDNFTELKCFFANEISRKAVLLPLEETKFCVFPLLHSDVLQGILNNSKFYLCLILMYL